MISIKNGAVKMAGDVPTLFTDLVILIHTFVENCEYEMDREQAEKLLVLAGKLALLKDDALEDEFNEIVDAFKKEHDLDT